MKVQIVFVKWGDRYGAEYVNVLAEEIAARSSSDLQFVCITEDRSGLDASIQTRDFPDFGVPFEDMRDAGGCRLKLSMFSSDVQLDNLKTVYIDLDTAIFGDVADLANVLDAHDTVHALPNHFVPHWKFSWLSWMTPEKCYFVNSSIVAFTPANHYDIFDDFKAELVGKSFPFGMEKDDPWGFKADENYISLHEKGKLRAFDKTMAGSFKDLYLTPWYWMTRWQDGLASVQKRRRERIALTFHGNAVKADLVAAMKIGDPVSVSGLKGHWNYPELSQYWRDFLAKLQQNKRR